ncbi:hypothetical protein NSU_1116 [Novosphingobium pentaromativorans US6-1]|uniref:Uncharacterized protein n=1 Tax=Novosphingobium pentaromativorans US6-1 TaxID=1088721 RepID=G6E9U5_9SPHN|nr:hypothetical protein NSU_1116 [Novosphingobium pentaromativorans US6-1]
MLRIAALHASASIRTGSSSQLREALDRMERLRKRRVHS